MPNLSLKPTTNRMRVFGVPNVIAAVGVGLASIIGVGMLPMTPLHPWNLVALVLLAGFGYAFFAALEKRQAPRHGIALLAALLGSGQFLYFQGRSHNWTLFATFPFVFFQLALIAQALLEAVPRARVLLVPLGLIVFVMGIGAAELVAATPRMAGLVTEAENKAGPANGQDVLAADAAFIRGQTQPGEAVLTLVRPNDQALLHDLSGTASAFNPGLMDLFWRKDLDRLVSLLSAGAIGKVFIRDFPLFGMYRPQRR